MKSKQGKKRWLDMTFTEVEERLDSMREEQEGARYAALFPGRHAALFPAFDDVLPSPGEPLAYTTSEAAEHVIGVSREIGLPAEDVLSAANAVAISTSQAVDCTRGKLDREHAIFRSQEAAHLLAALKHRLALS